MSFDFDIIMEVYFNDCYLNIHPSIMMDAIRGTMFGKRLMYIKVICGRKKDDLKKMHDYAGVYDISLMTSTL